MLKKSYPSSFSLSYAAALFFGKGSITAALSSVSDDGTGDISADGKTVRVVNAADWLCGVITKGAASSWIAAPRKLEFWHLGRIVMLEI